MKMSWCSWWVKISFNSTQLDEDTAMFSVFVQQSCSSTYFYRCLQQHKSPERFQLLFCFLFYNMFPYYFYIISQQHDSLIRFMTGDWNKCHSHVKYAYYHHNRAGNNSNNIFSFVSSGLILVKAAIRFTQLAQLYYSKSGRTIFLMTELWRLLNLNECEA